MPDSDFKLQGLNDEQVLQSRNEHGDNSLTYKKENGFVDALKSLAKEPMLLLLLAAASIYFVSGKYGDGIFMASAIVLVATISLYQDSRSRNALNKLKSYSEPFCKVIRNGETVEIKSEEIVINDCLIVEEGIQIAADGIILQSNDFSVNESLLTGESLPVYKDNSKEDNMVYRGTNVTGGLAKVKVTSIGLQTKIGKIGKALETIEEEPTPLELQINSFVKKMVIAGAIVFAIVWAINYFKSGDILDSLLKALTLAMSILPEEIPVAFTTFMALGAWRLMKIGIVVKQMKTVETLGSATVICTDKTGTITENKMTLEKLFVIESMSFSSATDDLGKAEKALLRTAMWASEPIPFDPMEIALHNAYFESVTVDERNAYKIIHEYPLSGRPPMMTHLFENEAGDRIIAAKGAPEALFQICQLSNDIIQELENAVSTLSHDGYRVLGVAEAFHDNNQFPVTQQEFNFQFKGLVAFQDPPKKNIKEVFHGFYKAGIDVKIVTGDNAATTAAIAKQIDFEGCDDSMTGDELMQLNEAELRLQVTKTHIFTRMFPEAKLRIINALKANGEIVAMTGDGVNDGPALKAAHIGIAMGKKGTEIARQAASLILLDDDLSEMLDAVAMGRRIYSNLKKAIRYIISIHIPIILTVFIPLALGWVYPNIFSPLHIIFLELIMGPTCSIIYENEPMEKNTMLQKPRLFTSSFFNLTELTTSIIQGLAITLGTLCIYRIAVESGMPEEGTRTMVFTTLIAANIILTLVNRSFYFSIFTTLRYRNKMVPGIILLTITLAAMILFIEPMRSFFGFAPIGQYHFWLSVIIGILSVCWYELIKFFQRRRNQIS